MYVVISKGASKIILNDFLLEKLTIIQLSGRTTALKLNQQIKYWLEIPVILIILLWICGRVVKALKTRVRVPP